MVSKEYHRVPSEVPQRFQHQEKSIMLMRSPFSFLECRSEVGGDHPEHSGKSLVKDRGWYPGGVDDET